MTDILEEVLRDQSYEKKVYVFKKILPFIVIFTIFTVIIMLYMNWYNEKTTKRNMEIGDTFLKSIDNLLIHNNTAEINEQQQLLENLVANSGNRVVELASLKQVKLYLLNKEHKKARVLLEKIIDNKSYYDVTTAYARIIWISLVIDNSEISENEKNQLLKYMDYFNDNTKPFFGTASIMKAIWNIKNNQLELARDELKSVMLVHTMPAVIIEQAKALLSKIEE